MGEVNNLEGFVDRGWHGVTYGQLGTRDVRLPHSLQQYVSRIPLFGNDIFFKLPHTRPNTDGFIYMSGEIDGKLHQSNAEYGLVKGGIGLTKSFEVLKREVNPDTFEPIAVERKFLRFIPYTQTKEIRKKGDTKHAPVYVDLQGNLTTNRERNEQLRGMLFEFYDQRWDHRGDTTQYTVVLRESDYGKLHRLISEDPSLMMQLYSQAFPEHRNAQGTFHFPQVNKFFFAQTPEELLRIKESLHTK